VTELQALQAALSAEYATVYGYGVAGAHLTGTDRETALDALQTHLELRDQLTAMVETMHATPAVAHAAYQLPFAVDSSTTARQLAAHLEQGVCGAMWDLVAAAGAASAARHLAIGWLADAAARTDAWGTAQALPGQPA
jgi:hypothetical protein